MNHISSKVYVGIAGLFEDYNDTLNSYDPHAFLIDGFNGQAHMSGKFHDFVRKAAENAIAPGSIITVHLNQEQGKMGVSVGPKFMGLTTIDNKLKTGRYYPTIGIIYNGDAVEFLLN